MTGGTVNIARSIWEDTAFKSEPMTEREAFMWLIMEASWKPREYRVGRHVVELQRGELASSVRYMAEAWQWSKSRVARYLERLRDRGMIQNRDRSGTASGTAITVISVCNYEEYQSAPKGSGTPSELKSGQKRDRSGTKHNKEIIPSKEGRASAAPDPAKLVFDSGVQILTAAGKSDGQARAIVGGWRKDYGDAQIISAIGACQREGAVNPVAFITAALKPRKPNSNIATTEDWVA